VRGARSSTSPITKIPSWPRPSARATATSFPPSAGTPPGARRAGHGHPPLFPARLGRIDWAEPANEPHASLLDWYRRLIAWYRRLIALRKQIPTLTDGHLERVHVHCDDDHGGLPLRRPSNSCAISSADRQGMTLPCVSSAAADAYPVAHPWSCLKTGAKYAWTGTLRRPRLRLPPWGYHTPLGLPHAGAARRRRTAADS